MPAARKPSRGSRPSPVHLVALLPLLTAWHWPGEINRLCQRAREAMTAGDAGAAVTLYSEAAAAGGETLELTYNLGTAQLAQRDYAGAVETLGRGVQQARDPAMLNRLCYNQGNAFFRLQQIEQAAKAYEQALAADPSDDDARYNLELCRELLKQQQPPPSGDQEKNDEQDRNNQGQQSGAGGGATGSGEQQQPDGGLSDLTEAEVDRLLRELEKDERQLRSYSRSQPGEDEAFGDGDYRSAMSGDGNERDW